MKKTSPAVRLAWAIGHALVGIAFFFSIIGVFGLGAAIFSLLLFIVSAVVMIYRTKAVES